MNDGDMDLHVHITCHTLFAHTALISFREGIWDDSSSDPFLRLCFCTAG